MLQRWEIESRPIELVSSCIEHARISLLFSRSISKQDRVEISCYLARGAWNFWLNLSTNVSSMKTFNELAGGDFLEFDSLLTFAEFIRRVYLNILSEITHKRYYTICSIIYIYMYTERKRNVKNLFNTQPVRLLDRELLDTFNFLSIFRIGDPKKKTN